MAPGRGKFKITRTIINLDSTTEHGTSSMSGPITRSSQVSGRLANTSTSKLRSGGCGDAAAPKPCASFAEAAKRPGSVSFRVAAADGAAGLSAAAIERPCRSKQETKEGKLPLQDFDQIK